MPVPTDAAARDALTARVAALADVRHPHLVAVLEARTVRPGALDVVHARGEVADLPAVLAVRGRLAPAEAAALGVHAAQALAAMHAAGLVHGPVEPADIVLRAGGAPALRPRAVLPPEEWTPAEDVRALARLVEGLLGSRPVVPGAVGALDGDPVADPEGALRAALAPALAADPRRRPEAGTLAALLDGACEPADIRLPDPATLAGAALAGARRAAAPEAGGLAALGGVPRRFRDVRAVGRQGSRIGLRGSGTAPGREGLGRRGAWWGPRSVRLPRWGALRPALVVVGVGLAVGLMTGAALELRGPEPAAVPLGAQEVVSPPASTAPAPAFAEQTAADPTRDRDRPEAAAATLTQRRLDLLAGAVTDVGVVDLVGSPAHAADTALLAQLAGSGMRLDGPRAAVSGAVVAAADGTTARVRLEYVVEAHAQVTADGTRTLVPASRRHSATLALRWTAGGWRVESVA